MSSLLIYFRDVVAAHLGVTPAEVTEEDIQRLATRLIIEEVREIDDERVEIIYTDTATGEQYTVTTERVLGKGEDEADECG